MSGGDIMRGLTMAAEKTASSDANAVVERVAMY